MACDTSMEHAYHSTLMRTCVPGGHHGRSRRVQPDGTRHALIPLLDTSASGTVVSRVVSGVSLSIMASTTSDHHDDRPKEP